jgi:hypothetical protein
MQGNNYNKPLQVNYKLLSTDDTGIINNNNDLINFIKNIFYVNDQDIYNISINITNNIINDINNYNIINFTNSNILRSSLALPNATSVTETITDTTINKNIYTSFINEIVKIYLNYIKSFKNIFADALLKAGGNCSDLNNINNMTAGINLYKKLVHPVSSDPKDFYFLNNEIMNNINDLFYKFIDELYFNLNNNVGNTNNPFISNVISNYNDYNSDIYKYDSFITENINVSNNNYISNEDNMKSNINTTSLSSTIVFIIIFIILLEPLYIE